LMLVLAAALRPRMPAPVARRSARDLLFVLPAVAILAATRQAMSSPDIGATPAMSSWLDVAAVVASFPVAVAVYRLANTPVSFALGLATMLGVGKVLAWHGAAPVYAKRNFFGVHQIRDDRRSGIRYLLHGSTIHGAQGLSDRANPEPLSYYSREGPVGDLFRDLRSRPGRRVGLIGLGTGAMAAYARPGEAWTAYEIDPLVVAISSNPRLFTFLSRSRAPVKVVIGDGRLSLLEAPDHYFDLLVLDAFTSDAIPVHLLTREALRIYLAKLAPHGVLAVHLSNRYLRLDPVLGNLVADARLVAAVRRAVPTPEEAAGAKAPSVWAVVVRNRADLGKLAEDVRWQELSQDPAVGLWTDDYSNIFRVFSIK
jgi:SAM-dependent methyltransferase